jgi:hypothetical protein
VRSIAKEQPLNTCTAKNKKACFLHSKSEKLHFCAIEKVPFSKQKII